MGYLFDRSRRISIDEGTSEPVAAGRAVYVMEESARQAAATIFDGMDPHQLVRFAFLPFPKVCMEWRYKDEQVCVLLEEGSATNQRTGEEFGAVVVAILVENAAGRQWQSSLYYVLGVSASGNIPWDTSSANDLVPEDKRMSREAQTNILSEIIVQMALINAPNLRTAEPRDVSKLNKAREKKGQPTLTPYTIIRPTSETREWMRSNADVDRKPAMEHWVKGHLHTYWTGPKKDQQKPIIKLLAPHKRGNPERGEKAQRYVVT